MYVAPAVLKLTGNVNVANVNELPWIFKVVSAAQPKRFNEVNAALFAVNVVRLEAYERFSADILV